MFEKVCVGFTEQVGLESHLVVREYVGRGGACESEAHPLSGLLLYLDGLGPGSDRMSGRIYSHNTALPAYLFFLIHFQVNILIFLRVYLIYQPGSRHSELGEEMPEGEVCKTKPKQN